MAESAVKGRVDALTRLVGRPPPTTMRMTNSKPTGHASGGAAINTRTTVSLPLYVSSVVGGITFAVLITLWITAQRSDQTSVMERMIEQVRTDVRTVSEQVKELNHLARDRWGAQNMEVFALRLQNQNPNIKVPEVRDIKGAK